MDSDHWRARAKGGIFRRDFLKYAGRFVQWAATVWAGAAAGDFLAQRRERAKKNIIAAEGRAAGTAVVLEAYLNRGEVKARILQHMVSHPHSLLIPPDKIASFVEAFGGQSPELGSVSVRFINNPGVTVIPRPPLVDGHETTAFLRLVFAVAVRDFTSRIYFGQGEATMMFKGGKFAGPLAVRTLNPTGWPVG
jgi:hypothetical protein